jgi:hypothetical protein
VTYDPSDPRAELTAAPVLPGAGAAGDSGSRRAAPRPVVVDEIGRRAADVDHQRGSCTWWTHSTAVIVGVTHALSGDELVLDVAGEHVVLVLDGAAVDVAHVAGSVSVVDDAVVIVPPGESSIRVVAPGTIVRLIAAAAAWTEPPFTGSAGAVPPSAVPAGGPDPNVAPFVAWPDPPEGHRTRVYRLADHPVEPGRFGRIFRCSTVMVNVLPEDEEPRDPTRLSPHHHDDFEQISLQLHGSYVHHTRVPWTPDSTTWRDDEHLHCDAPAVVVIPPGLVHTSQSVGRMRHWLVDAFVPPRADFSARPGWVLNADEYPMPAT